MELVELRDAADRPVLPPYEHAVTDAGFCARVASRYAGEHDLLDALWWLDHPDDLAPSGAPSPRRLLSIARRSLYDRQPAPTDLERYTSAADRERSDRTVLVAAVAAAESAEPEPPEVEVQTDAAQADVAPVPAGPARPRSRSLRFRWGAVLLTALAVVAVLGWSRGLALPAAIARSTVLVEVSTVPVDALPLLVGTAGKVPEPRVRLRRLAVVAGTAVIARLTKGIVCLELRGRGTMSGACRPVAEFRARGLQLPFPTGSDALDEVRWLPDGRLQLVTVH
jgi:hypothetical protein